MPETSDAPDARRQLAASLASQADSPYVDTSITDPATITDLTASLATASHRLPQLLNTIGAWLLAETAAGRIADDHHRTSEQLAVRICAATAQAADSADDLTIALAAVHNLTAALHSTQPATPGS